MNNDPEDDRSHNLNSANLSLVQYETEMVRVPASEVTNSPSWEEVVGVYLASAIDSENTRSAYRRHLLRAGVAMGVTSVDVVTGADLAEYRRTVTACSWAPSTQAQALAAVRSFLAWVGAVGGHTLNPQAIRLALKTPRATVLTRYQILTDAEIRAMLEAAPSTREQALMAILVGAGLRVTECVSLDLSDLLEDEEGNLTLFVRLGKGRKDRMVPVRGDVAALVRVYVDDTRRFIGEGGALFLSRDRGVSRRSVNRLSPRGAQILVKQLAADAGIRAKRVTPHALRHSYAIRCLRAGANVVAVSKLLGHSTLSTTSRYVDHLQLSELRGSVPDLPAGLAEAS